MPAAATAPPRLVDRDGRTWDLVETTPAVRYVPYPYTGATPSTLTQIVLRSGPVRPVAAMPDYDRDFLTRLLMELAAHDSHRVIPTVCAALYYAHLGAGPRAPLTAGRPGSWESKTLTSIISSTGRDLFDGDHADQYDKDTMYSIGGVIVGWATNPASFVEVAENLASALGPVIDHAGGWHKVIPRGFRRDPNANAIRTWATSRSAHPS